MQGRNRIYGLGRALELSTLRFNSIYYKSFSNFLGKPELAAPLPSPAYFRTGQSPSYSLYKILPFASIRRMLMGNILIRDTGRLRDILIHQLTDKVLDDGMIGRN